MAASIRLHGGDKPWNGYAQTYKNGTWGAICDLNVNETGWPTVFCRELGFSVAQSAHMRGTVLSFTLYTGFHSI